MDQIGPSAPSVYQQQDYNVTAKPAFLEFHLLANVWRYHALKMHFSWTAITMINYFSLSWKKNITNFQDILQHRNDPDLNHSAIHCSCFLTSPNLQEILLDVETCPAQIPSPSHGYHCEPGEQNTSICAANLHWIHGTHNDLWQGREELWQRDHFLPRSRAIFP